MLDATIDSAKSLLREVWDVESEQPPSPWRSRINRGSERLTNCGVTVLYTILLAYAGFTVFQLFPPALREQTTQISRKPWVAVGLVLLAVTSVRVALVMTKWFKRWSLGSLIGSLLLFDFLLDRSPPLFGFEGYSFVESLVGNVGQHDLAEFIRRGFGM